jgi:hypothetical protein
MGVQAGRFSALRVYVSFMFLVGVPQFGLRQYRHRAGGSLGDPAALVTYQQDRCSFKLDLAHPKGTLKDITET